MELPQRNGSSFGEMFDGIKSKLGFSDRSARDSYGASDYDAYNDYDEFAEYAPSADDGYGDAAGSYASYPYTSDGGSDYDYDEFAEYAPAEFVSDDASARDGVSDSEGSRNPSRKVRAPKLVSIDDVRAHTQVPDSLKRNPLPERKVTKPSSVVANWSSRLTNRGQGSDTADAPRSAGLRSLFDSTTNRAGDSAASSADSGQSSAPDYAGYMDDYAANPGFDEPRAAVQPQDAAYDTAQGSYAQPQSTYTQAQGAYAQEDAARVDAQDAYDPYDAYVAPGAAGQQSFVAKRHLTIIAPMSYGDVEGVARALKAGDVVVLVLTRTPDTLSKRVLDFSFGAASALDASVDSVGNKVFAIARDHGLTPAERTELRSQGVL